MNELMTYILIVDDDAMMAQTLADMVELFDWKTTIVHGPRHAMHAIQNDPPALILLDLNMPGVDGMEVCRFIKRDPVAEKTMVVFVTAEDDPSIQQKAREAGAADYLVKPVDVDRLESILDKLSKEKKAQAEKAAQLDKAAPTAPPAPPAPTAPAAPLDKVDQTSQTEKTDKADKKDPPAKTDQTDKA
jgi:DNA-binding response OmpR family regulator